ncbi:MAG: B12-binding domain-containing radical SAM protein [Endomicrobia bacterium]|nr:B12-binding domain-containing radical SAM protein [Endomicrobiia bacterium]MDW8055174.1 radical SAM protein [Elusimicrobiota bacterium]
MKVLFIFPPKNNWALRNIKLHKKIDEESGFYPPLGILYVASYLKKELPSCEVKIIDAPSEKLDYIDIKTQISNFAPDVVGIYFCTEYLYDALQTAKVVKQLNSKIFTVAGGPHVFIYPFETIKEPEIDFVIYGEAEIVFTKLIECLKIGKFPDDIIGVITKNNIDKDHKIQYVEKLDGLTFPNRTLLNYKKYKSFITYKNPITTMMTSRGCAYNCYYCNSIERAKKVRFHSPEYVVKEIESIVKLGIKDIIFFDENFTFDIDRVEAICDLLIEKKLNIRWHCRSRADMKLDKRILRKMKEAGCRMIQFGIETATPHLQKLINKHLDLEQVKKVIKLCKDVGILTYGNFMLGLPTETPKEMLNTINFAIKLNLDYAPFGVFNPLPKSVFYEKAIKEGIINKDYWLEYVKNPDKPISNYWWPLHNKEMLNRMNYLAFRKFYFRVNYILKAIFRRQSLTQKFWQAKSVVRLFLS